MAPQPTARPRKRVAVRTPAGVARIAAGAAIAASVFGAGMLSHGPGISSRSRMPLSMPAGTAIRVAVIGDSLSTGYGTTPDDAWPNLINADGALGSIRPVLVNAARNGSGYLNPGDDGSVFRTQVVDAVDESMRAVIFFGSENDIGSDPAELARAMTETFAQARAKAPAAALIVVGPPAYTDNPEPERLQVRDQVRAAALGAGARFIDPITERWIVGRTDELLGPDGDHPSEAGQHYLKDRMEQLLAPVIAPEDASTSEASSMTA